MLGVPETRVSTPVKADPLEPLLSKKELKSILAVLHAWQMRFNSRSQEVHAHAHDSRKTGDPPYWSDFLRPEEFAVSAVLAVAAGTSRRSGDCLKLREADPVEHGIFVCADRFIGRSRFVAMREDPCYTDVTAFEYAALLKLIQRCFQPPTSPWLFRLDVDRILLLTDHAAFPCYLSRNYTEHNRFPTLTRRRDFYTLPFVAYPRPDAGFFQEHRHLTPWCVTGDTFTGGTFEFCEGYHVSIRLDKPRKRVDCVVNGRSESFAQRRCHYEILLRKMKPDADPEELERYIAAGEASKPLVFATRNWGLLHMECPYSVSRNVVFVDDPALVEKVLQVSDALHLGLREGLLDELSLGTEAVLPLSYPPALEDGDFAMQECFYETGHAFRDANDSRQYVEKHLARMMIDLGADELGGENFDRAIEQAFSSGTIDEDPAIAEARLLVRNSLFKLRELELLSQWVSREILEGSVLESVFQDLRTRREWEVIATRWQQSDTKLAGKSKNKKKRQQERAATKEKVDLEKSMGARGNSAERLKVAVEEIDRKIWKYRHYTKYLNVMQKAQLLHHFDCGNISGGRLVLHGTNVPALIFRRPHGGSRDKCPREIPRQMRKLEGYV